MGYIGSLSANAQALPAAYKLKEYLPLLKGKRVGVFANHTSSIGRTHLIDTLLKSGVTIAKAFSPEHGFRGGVEAGERVENGIDSATGVRLISLYGNKHRPSTMDLQDVDVLLFDVQDVGVRFYTYISSLQNFLEAAIQHDKPLIILDRPNPNGFYVDGPVLDPDFKSFVGMQAVPVVYGMTIGEYARMLLGEKWLDWKYIKKEDGRLSLGELLGFEKEHKKFQLKVIVCANYSHATKYRLPIPPSPNLPDMVSVYWYPSTCFFEGTTLSEGRGTEHPFCIIGHPRFPDSMYRFVPKASSAAQRPKWKDSLCHGFNLYASEAETLKATAGKIQLWPLLKAWELHPNKSHFFLPPTIGMSPKDTFFNKLAGSSQLMYDIMLGKKEADIRKSWKEAITAFKKTRKKYLLYPDFE